jgi:phenylacetate-CoA ligase
LQAQLRRARRTPFWRELLPPGACLEDVPPLDRDTLRRRYSELCQPDLTTPVWQRTTSGSTGRPVKVAHGPETVGHAAAARLRQLTWFGLPPRNHSQANIKVAAAADDPPIWVEPRHPPLFAINPYALDRTTVATVHRELLAAGGIRLAGGVSSLLARWAALYGESGLDGRELGVALAIVGGEMTYPVQRHAVRDTFGCRVAEMYGSHELSLIGLECERGSLHVAEECVLVELIDEDGRRVRPASAAKSLSRFCTTPRCPSSAIDSETSRVGRGARAIAGGASRAWSWRSAARRRWSGRPMAAWCIRDSFARSTSAASRSS